MCEPISDESTDPDDRLLLLAVAQSRDEKAFDGLTSRYREPLRRFLFAQTGEPGAAEDVLQETFLRLWTRAASFDGRGPVKAWLFRIAGNLASNHRRTVARRREASLVHKADTEDGSEDDGAFLPEGLIESASLGPDAQVLRRAQSERLKRTLDELPGDARELIRLAYSDEQSVREVAGVLGVPEGTVKSRLFHARKRFARAWEAQDDNE